MFRKNESANDDTEPSTEPELANDLQESPSIGARLHQAAPLVLLGFGLLVLALGLHGAGTAAIGLAGAHVVLAIGLLASRRVMTRRSR